MSAVFNGTKFFQISAGFGENVSKHICSYNDDDNVIADMKVSGFFDDSAPKLNHQDLIYICASDEQELVYVASVDPVTVVDIVTSSSGTIPDGSITTAKLADGSVTHAKLATASVSADKVEDLGIDAGKYAANSIATADIGPLQITAPLMAVASVTGNTIADSGILSGKYAAGSIQHTDIGNGACSGLNIADLGVIAGKYAAGSIAKADLNTAIGTKVLQHSAAATAATSTAFTVTGVLASDKAFATMSAGFSQAITGVVCTVNTVTVHYAAAAEVTDTVEISVFRGGA